MCAVNDAKRKEYDNQIRILDEEYDNEKEKLDDIERARGEVQSAIELAQCVVDNISLCDFGGDKILSSIETSQQGYKDKEDYYDEYVIKCNEAISEIMSEINDLKALKSALPVNCGSCNECNPPVASVPKNKLKMGKMRVS